MPTSTVLQVMSLLLFGNKLFNLSPATATMSWWAVLLPLFLAGTLRQYELATIRAIQEEMTANTNRLLAENERNRRERQGVVLPVGDPHSPDD